MTHSQQQNIVLPPNLTLRQAVRPAIFAYGILSQQQSRGDALVNEANYLLGLTEDLLSKMGFVHLLAGEADVAGVTEGPGSQADRLAAAYANAGLSWAAVIASLMKLGEDLVSQGCESEVRRLANCLEACGETALAKELNDNRRETDHRKREEAYRGFMKRLEAIGRYEANYSGMSRAEIQPALETVSSALAEFPDGVTEVIDHYLAPLIFSTRAIVEGLLQRRGTTENADSKQYTQLSAEINAILSGCTSVAYRSHYDSRKVDARHVPLLLSRISAILDSCGSTDST